MVRIIICNDGTWNSPDDEDRGKRKPINISKISRAICPVDSNGISQIVYYGEGVGTEFGQNNWWYHWRGAFVKCYTGV